jgi:hypothetical protein
VAALLIWRAPGEYLMLDFPLRRTLPALKIKHLR